MYLSFGRSKGTEAITKGFSNTNVYFLILGKSHSNTSSNSSLNRLESPSNDLVRSENSVYVDDKSQMRSNHLLDSPQSTSSSQSNLSNNEYSFTQVFKSYFKMRRIMKLCTSIIALHLISNNNILVIPEKRYKGWNK